MAGWVSEDYHMTIFNDLKTLPHFDPDLSAYDPPEQIVEFRKNIELADGIIFCTPEYVFTIPSGLKNAIEWCISTTVFLDKPIGLITASANGQKGHEELQLIMKTIMAKFNDKTCLLIQGIRGKFDAQGNLTDTECESELKELTAALLRLINNE